MDSRQCNRTYTVIYPNWKRYSRHVVDFKALVTLCDATASVGNEKFCVCLPGTESLPLHGNIPVTTSDNI